jgi:2-polyprenyl-3-methyl-5-hydroxy-6-metoxy-1,4-benzoquinol methylase
MNRSPQAYWEKTNASFDFEKPSPTDYTRIIINKYIPSTENGTAIEIGCYPGRYLSIFGDLGYTLHGIDLTARTPETKTHLEKNGYKVGEIEVKDFLDLDPNKKYTVVTSFGFIEHFENYNEIIDRHCSLVDNAGYIVIGAPNFRYGIQYLFHRLFNSRGLKRHVLRSMSPKDWATQLQKNGFEVLFAKYCGGPHFWMDGDQSRTQHFFGLQALRLVRIIKALLFWVKFDKVNSKYWSCDFIVIGKKN